MVHLREMRADEFSGFVTYFVPDYAAEISSNYDLDLDAARARAERELKEDLGMGVETPNQALLCIVKTGDESDTPIGYLWCKPDKLGESVFISDFCILHPHRGKGYARSALTALEAKFAEAGYCEARLRVATDNIIAERLYLAAGFRPTGTNMRKAFEKSEP
ncbi:putative N-acetyltransferase YycN [Roseibium album]|nr:putative N-acetyltransferase YycN [Roseibium album]